MAVVGKHLLIISILSLVSTNGFTLDNCTQSVKQSLLKTDFKIGELITFEIVNNSDSAAHYYTWPGDHSIKVERKENNTWSELDFISVYNGAHILKILNHNEKRSFKWDQITNIPNQWPRRNPTKAGTFSIKCIYWNNNNLVNRHPSPHADLSYCVVYSEESIIQ